MNAGLTRRGVLRAAATTLIVGAPEARAAAAGALDELLGRRRMVRKFRPDPVSDDVVQRLLATATRAPSAGNLQPWAFVVVRDADMRARLASAAHDQAFVAEAPLAIVACADASRCRPRYRERAERYALIDTAFASLLLLLAVVEEGLGACFVGAFEDGAVTRALGLPRDVQPVAIIPVGRPAEPARRLRRRALGDVVHRERW
jgi:nitroreductase